MDSPFETQDLDFASFLVSQNKAVRVRVRRAEDGGKTYMFQPRYEAVVQYDLWKKGKLKIKASEVKDVENAREQLMTMPLEDELNRTERYQLVGDKRYPLTGGDW